MTQPIGHHFKHLGRYPEYFAQRKKRPRWSRGWLLANHATFAFMARANTMYAPGPVFIHTVFLVVVCLSVECTMQQHKGFVRYYLVLAGKRIGNICNMTMKKCTKVTKCCFDEMGQLARISAGSR